MGVHIPISKKNYKQIKERELQKKIQLQIDAKNSVKGQKFWKLAQIIIGLEILSLSVLATSLVLPDFFMEKVALCLLAAITLISVISGLVFWTIHNAFNYCMLLSCCNVLIIVVFFYS